MPVIKPFSALIPAASLQSVVVTRPLEYYSSGEARLIASENNNSFLHLIHPVLNHEYLRDAPAALVYRKIRENYEDFLDREVLEETAGIGYYIYQVTEKGLSQTGLWALSDVKGYQDGTIRKHEHTVRQREERLSDYLQHTGLDANPVLITYAPDAGIDALISSYTRKVPLLDFTFTDGTAHRVWTVSAAADQELLSAAFAALGPVYIADGHHRAAAMSAMSFFSSVYMNTREIRIMAFHRLVKDLNGLDGQTFLELIARVFIVETSSGPFLPKAHHEIGMYLQGQWYCLEPPEGSFREDDPVETLDVHILQQLLLEPVLGIADPRTDARLSFEGGDIAAEVLQEMVDNGLYAVAFTLFPVTAAQLIRVADAGRVMPPKSTWITPKFLVGLLTHFCG